MKNKIQCSILIVCIAVSTIIICVLVSFKDEPIQKKLATFIGASIVIESCKNHIELKNWLHTKTFRSSEVRNCVLDIKNGTSRTLYFAGNSIIRNLMTDLTEIVNSQKHIDYTVYKKHCSRDAGGSYMKNCNFTGIVGGTQNKTLVPINLESAQYFGDVNRWFSKSDVVVLMVGHHYLITEGKNDTWFSHFWNDFDLFLSQYKIWIKNSSSRHLTYITPTYFCCSRPYGYPSQEFHAKLYNTTRAAAEKLYAAGASVLDLFSIMSPQNEISPFSCSHWATRDCIHPSSLNAKFIQLYVNGMCTDQRPGDTLATRQHFWIGT